jgi:hypothetical protein
VRALYPTAILSGQVNESPLVAQHMKTIACGAHRVWRIEEQTKVMARWGNHIGWYVDTLAVLCLVLVLAPGAYAPKRVALVTGNDTYETLPDLNAAHRYKSAAASGNNLFGFQIARTLSR